MAEMHADYVRSGSLDIEARYLGRFEMELMA
jgi:hypothetical protein